MDYYLEQKFERRHIKLFEEFLNEAESLRSKNVKVFYTPKQVLQDVEKSYSKSPQKPMLMMKKLKDMGLDDRFDVEGGFTRFEVEDFLVAHTPEYVNAVLTGNDEKLRSSNSIPWTAELAETVRYTNSSLYNAIKYSIEHPETPCFSPTSGFHHAHHDRGSGFCTFAGQVIASVKLFREKGVRGAYFDLDGHFGNSIEDCRGFVKDLNSAVPKGFNINPQGSNGDYLNYLIDACAKVENAVMNKEIDYVVWCHGADSHEHDDLGGQVDTEHWVKCAEVFYTWVKSVDEKLAAVGRKPLPLTMSLFGGYRKDSYDSVISLHTKDMVLCLNILCGDNIEYEASVVPKKPKVEKEWHYGRTTSVKPHEKSNSTFSNKYSANDGTFLTKHEANIVDFLRAKSDDDYHKADEIPNASDYSLKYLLDNKFIQSNGSGYRYNWDKKK
jgi:acetoin utilization deacetylase AcuC-like enzyme